MFHPAVDAVHLAMVRVTRISARTPAGVRGKAAVCRAVLAMDEPEAAAGGFDAPGPRHDVLAWSLLRAMAELGA